MWIALDEWNTIHSFWVWAFDSRQRGFWLCKTTNVPSSFSFLGWFFAKDKGLYIFLFKQNSMQEGGWKVRFGISRKKIPRGLWTASKSNEHHRNILLKGSCVNPFHLTSPKWKKYHIFATVCQEFWAERLINKVSKILTFC